MIVQLYQLGRILIKLDLYLVIRILLGLAPITIWLVCWVTFPRIPTAASFTSAWYTSDIFAIHVIYNFPSRKWRFLVTNLLRIEMELIVITSLMIERHNHIIRKIITIIVVYNWLTLTLTRSFQALSSDSWLFWLARPYST